MKLTELILELHTIMLKEGNLDVYTLQGDTEIPGEPVVRMDEYPFETKYYPGVYLN